MDINKKKNLKLYFFLFVLVLFAFVIIKNFQKEKVLPSVHPNLSWEFKPVKSKIKIKPGEVATIEYIVKNIGTKDSTGIATFAYFPKQIGSYISKINCFCYDAKTLKSKEKDKFILVLLIDPEATKDSKTKNIKKATIQFTFFDYKEYKDNKS